MDILAEKNKLEDVFTLRSKGKEKVTGTLNVRIRYVNLRNLREAKVCFPAKLDILLTCITQRRRTTTKKGMQSLFCVS